MLRIDKVEKIKGISVYDDGQANNRFYVVPDTPRFRLDENGLPVFKFLKYRFPIDRADDKKGGGYILFDTEFVVPDDKLEAVKSVLQERLNKKHRRKPPQVEIGTITYTKGTASLLLNDESGALIEKARSPGKPSLFGRNITPFALELTPEGATLFEQALQGKGGVVQVVYDLYFPTKLPPIKATVSFVAKKFYSFYQDIDVNWRFWKEDSYRETIREQFRESESGNVDLDFGFTLPDAEKDSKLKQQIRDWAWRTLEDLIEKKMIEAIAPVPADDRKRPEGIENVTRDITVKKIGSFTHRFKEDQAVEWNMGPRGTLPNITTLTDKDGNPLKWEDYAKEVDLNDPFFRQLNVSVQVNADFENLPLHSVELKLDYDDKPVGECRFTKPDDVGKFATYIENDNWKYKYSYQINYKGESRQFQSVTMETDDRILTVGVDDIGVLSIDIAPGDINFDEVKEAQVVIRYEDSEHGVELIERQFKLDKDHQAHRFQKVIFEPRRKPYSYKVKYTMSNGKEYNVDWQEARSPQLYINDPFVGMRTIGIRALGNLETEIDTIFIDLKYKDETNDYTQTQSVALSKNQPFFDWAFPVIDENAGKLFYSGNTKFKDGTSDEIPETETTESTILVGKKVEDFLEVQVTPDLVDFEQVKLVKVSLRYDDPENKIKERKDIVLKKDTAKITTWKVELKNKNLIEYQWQAFFYMADKSERETELVKTSEPTIILKLPTS